MRAFAWISSIIAGLVALLSAAPFTPAIFLAPVLLICAALSAWKGQVVPAVITGSWCAAALAMSPITITDAPLFWVIVTGCSMAFAVALFTHKKHAHAA
ncbi:hypothetical protein [Corticibacter populi]|uniref:hypothetical protein n=1 Tax=Corticibacter populi TaxID=1550736 RepID=UPI00102B3F2F|nr:hypothetical protein [Corticibacter populi]RZS30947.1 hypothetical protein EV687_3146 [Corticibacter populi]